MICWACRGTGYDPWTFRACVYCAGLGGPNRAPASKRGSFLTVVLTVASVVALIVALLLIAALLFGGH